VLKSYWTAGNRVLRRVAERRCLKNDSAKGIGIIGWAGNRNLGDESIRDAISNTFPEFRLYNYGGKRVESLLGKLGYSGGDTFQSVLVGGGTLINAGYLPLVRGALETGLRVAYWGTGVGSSGFSELETDPLGDWEGVLKKSGMIGVRGPLSRQRILTNWGVDAEIVGDVALHWTLSSLPPERRKRRLIVNLSSPDGSPAREPIRSIISAVAATILQFRAEGGEVVLVALGEQDESVLSALSHNSALQDLSVVSIRESTKEFLQVVNGASCMICVRLHAAVLACCAGVPPIVYNYRDKCLDFMASMEIEDYVIAYETDSGANLGSALEKVLRGGAALRRRIYQKARYWQLIQEKAAPRIRSALVG
jgi:polysaccharide pyruvyl transferase WcaK-like protein